MDVNPYESPQAIGYAVAGSAQPSGQSPILWFLASATLANAACLPVVSPVIHLGGPPWSFRSLVGTILFISISAVVGAVLTLLASGLLGLIVRRRYPATQTSRISAGIASALALSIAFMLWMVIGFRGPPGLITVPSAAITAFSVDRLLSWLTHRRA